MERNILDLIEAHLEVLLPLEKEVNDARWKSGLHGRPVDAARLVDRQRKLEELFADRESYARILTYDEGGLTETETTRRQLRLLRLAYASCQLPKAGLERIAEEEAELRRTIDGFRVPWNGEELTLEDVNDWYYAVSDNDDRYRLWEGANVLAERIGPAILRLVGIRNRAARELDYPDYYRMSLDLQELSEPRLFLTIEELVRKTMPAWQELKDEMDDELSDYYDLPPSQLRPWHYTDTFFDPDGSPPIIDVDKFYSRKDPTKIAASFFEGIGMDVGDIIRRSDLGPREGKDPSSRCIHMDRTGRDIRVSVAGPTPEERMRRILHWIAVAAGHKFLDPNLPPILRRPAHPLISSAVGRIFGGMSRAPDFLRELVGAHKPTVAKGVPLLNLQRRRDMLIRSRWVPVMVHFEKALYENPGQDLNRTWWDLVHYYLGIEPPENRAGRHDWAIHLDFALRPGQCHEGLMSELIASQLRATMREKCGESIVGNTAIGPLLTKGLFRPGSTRNWIDTLEAVTGDRLKTTFFLDEYLEERG